MPQKLLNSFSTQVIFAVADCRLFIMKFKFFLENRNRSRIFVLQDFQSLKGFEKSALDCLYVT